MEQFAVIKTGGKQYLVAPGQKIKIEKIDLKENEKAVFDKVLLFQDKDKFLVGNPYLENVKVEGKVVKQGKAKKVIVFKFKRKNRYKKKAGHRQPYTEVEITKILS
jgi:large subunit ribosomal protein L21